MFTVEIQHKTVDEIVFSFHPPTDHFHARLVPRSGFCTATILADRDLDHLIARVRARLGDIGYIDPRLVAITKRWRPCVPSSNTPAAA